MKIITIDFETYWATDYTLNKMSTSAYVADPRFQMIMVAVKINNSPAQVLSPDQWEVFYKSVDWSEVYILCHHTHFDGLILALYYGVNPKGWLDTLSMSRALDGPHAKHSLEELARRYNAGEKGKEIYNTKGKRLEDFTAYEYQEYMKYSENDANLTFDIFVAMMKRGFPATELELIDIVIRMFTEPKFQLEVSEVQEHLDWERERKQALLDRLDQEKKSVSGNKTFADLLVEQGIDPPLKYSVKKSEKAGHAVMDYAFAKTDPGFQDLLEHEDEDVRLLAEARVSVKSTQTESRSQRMIDMATRYEYLPVYLVVGAAHTHRLGGGDKVNWQNFERTDKKNPRKGKIRKAIKAPEGHKIVVADSAQIEARKVAYLAGHESLLTQFRNGEDVYSKFASVLYGRVVDRKNNPEDEIAGHVGKCLAKGTIVVTDKGFIPIEDVNESHKLWDGEEWVCHKGTVSNGLKQTQQILGVWLTPDHLVLSGQTWVQAQHLDLEENTLPLALEIASEKLLSLAISLGLGVGSFQLSQNAVVEDQNTHCYETTSGTQDLGIVPYVRGRLVLRNDTGYILRSCLTMGIGQGYLIDLVQQSADAITKRTCSSNITGLEVFKSIKNGVITERCSSHMYSQLWGGITKILKWIGQTITSVINRVTLGSVHDQKTVSIGEESKTLKRLLPVYDLACAGPRNRFTILSNKGPLIVHNCQVLGLGYGMGWVKLASEMARGMLGGPVVIFDEKFLEVLNFDPSRFLSNPKNIDKVRDMPSRIPLRQRLIHCAVSNHIVKTYRETNKPIQDLHKFHEKVLQLMVEEFVGVVEHAGVPINIDRHKIILPNGLFLHYKGITKDDRGFTYFNGRNVVYLHGGVVTENRTQALCRILITDPMRVLQREYNGVKGMTHDEIIQVVPTPIAQECFTRTLKLMASPPDWCKGLPIKAEGGIGDRYGSIK